MARPPDREPAEWVVRRPLRTPGTNPGTPTPPSHQPPPSPHRKDSPSPPPDHPPPLVGVQLVRPRPLLRRGPRALQLDSSHATAGHGSCEEIPEEQSATRDWLTEGQRVRTRMRLDEPGPHGWVGGWELSTLPAAKSRGHLVDAIVACRGQDGRGVR